MIGACLESQRPGDQTGNLYEEFGVVGGGLCEMVQTSAFFANVSPWNFLDCEQIAQRHCPTTRRN